MSPRFHSHSVCLPCWNEREPERIAVKLKAVVAEVEWCCYCGSVHASGIYQRGEVGPNCHLDGE